MTTVLEREGKEWAWNVVRNMSSLAIDGKAEKLIQVLSLGTQNKPVAYARGVHEVIGMVRLELNKGNRQGSSHDSA